MGCGCNKSKLVTHDVKVHDGSRVITRRFLTQAEAIQAVNDAVRDGKTAVYQGASS